jgi:hypothetical protein
LSRLTSVSVATLVTLALTGALLASPAAAATPSPSPAPLTGVKTGGDQLSVSGTTPIAPKASVKQMTAAVGATAVAGTTGVEKVWVSVATATTATSDDVNAGLTQAAVQTLIGQLNSYWSAQSEGAVTIQLAGFETRSVGEASCAPSNVLSYEEQNAFGGMFARSAWRGTHNHLLVLTKESCSAESFATVGGTGGEIFSGNGISTDLGMPYLLHEFGHNLGFEHADASICANSGSFDATLASFSFTSATCPTTEYDDYLDIMGYTVKGATPNLSSPQQIQAGWLTAYDTATKATVPASTTYTLSPLGGTTGTRALKIVDPVNGDDYYVEYRTPQGRDATSAEFHFKEQCDAPRDGYTICDLGSSTTAGIVRILRVLPFPSDNATGTTVMATGLLAGSTSKVKRQTRLDTGQTFTNYDNGFLIKLNSLSEAHGASVTVSFVVPAPTTTTVSLTKSSQVYGNATPAVATATVRTSNRGTPTGSVAFYDGSTRLATVPVDGNGTAAYTLSRGLTVKKHLILGKFVPNATAFIASTSSSHALTVGKTKATMAIRASLTTLTKSHHEVVTVTFTATGVTPTGTLGAYVNGKKKKSYTMPVSDRGKRTLTLPKFSTRGTKSIVVRYSGDSHVGSRSSSTVKVKVR